MTSAPIFKAVDEKASIFTRKATVEMLKKLRITPNETLDNVINRLIRMDGVVFLDVISVNGELARMTKHEVIVQLGDNPPRFYHYQRGRITNIDKLPLKVDLQKSGALRS